MPSGSFRFIRRGNAGGMPHSADDESRVFSTMTAQCVSKSAACVSHQVRRKRRKLTATAIDYAKPGRALDAFPNPAAKKACGDGCGANPKHGQHTCRHATRIAGVVR